MEMSKSLDTLGPSFTHPRVPRPLLWKPLLQSDSEPLPDVLPGFSPLLIFSRPQWMVWIRRSWLFIYSPQALWASRVTWENHWSEANVWDSCFQWSTETWSKSLIYSDTLQTSDACHYKFMPSQHHTDCMLWKVINKHPDVLSKCLWKLYES